jgi:hypothetical protein
VRLEPDPNRKPMRRFGARALKWPFRSGEMESADLLSVPRRHEPGVNILMLVRDWFQRADISPWLIILDNADDLTGLFDSNTTADSLPLAYCLPKTTHGRF